MIINDIQYNASLEEIMTELQFQLRANQIPYFEKGFRDSGDDLMVQCPYHGGGQERKPSMGIRKSDGLCNCFACHEAHSLPEVISYCFGYNDILGKEGIKWLTKNFATVQIEERKEIELDLSREGKVENKKEYVSEEELDEYRYYHPYWKKRKITDEHIIELFDLGYDNTTQCITMPVRDIDGNCLFVARRSVKTKFFSYPKGVEKPLYGLYELYQQEEFPSDIYVCESMIDALTIWCYNRYAVALNGLGNELSLNQLKELPCRHIILATDNDDAGKNARLSLKQKLNNKIITELNYNTYPPNVKDINDMSKEQFYDIEEIF